MTIMITDSVSETLIVYMYLVICCVKFLELAINEIFIETFLVKAHC